MCRLAASHIWIGLLDEHEGFLSEAKLVASLVAGAKENLLGLALAPHGTSLMTQVVELDPIDESLYLDGRALHLRESVLGLTADNSAFTPLIRHVSVLVDRETIE